VLQVSALLYASVFADCCSNAFCAEPKVCSIEGFRRLLNVECDAAIAVANIIGISLFVVVMIICLIVVKKRLETMNYSFLLDISIVPLQVHCYSEALPTTALILCRT